jgi:hypothetical protein
VENVAAELGRLREAGVEWEAQIAGSEQSIYLAYTHPRGLDSLRLEVVSESSRRRFEHFIRTGRWLE